MRIYPLVVLACLLVLVGCKKAPPAPAKVDGLVTYDNNALAKGTVQFNTDRGTIPISVEIEGGRFQATLPPGKYRIEITAYRERLKPLPPPHEPIENYLPSRYNTESTMEIEVAAGETREVKYDLTSAK